MVLPLAAAIIGGSLISGGASMLAGSAASKAASNAAKENNALARELYDKTAANMTPWMDRGNVAGDALMSHLGLGGAASGGSGGASGGGFNAQAYLEAYPDVAAEYARVNGPGLAESLGLPAGSSVTPEQFAAWHYQSAGQNEGRQAFAQPDAAGTGAPAEPTTIGGQQVDAYGAVTTPRDIYTRPEYSRPETEAFSFGLDDYTATPGYSFQQERGMGALKADKTLGGLLRSGSALKGALDFSQNLAMQDFTGERDFAYANYLADRDFKNANFNADRAYGAGVFESDRGYGADVYNSDRAYTSGRYDTRTGDLMGLSGQGLSGANALAGQANNYLSNVSGNNNSAAAAKGNAALNTANNVNSLVGNAMYAFGRGGSSGTGSSYGQGGSYYGSNTPVGSYYGR